jgi:16S rRNA (cytidine1402-2'-O)-methyltransferase
LYAKIEKMSSIVYMIPTFLDEENGHVIPPYVLEAIKNCQVFFVENERSARRYLKSLWREMVIDNYEWISIDKHVSGITKSPEVHSAFRRMIKDGKNIGIISEAGCPGIADPGQELVAIAQSMEATIRPLVGPSSILLALMASGMNGQQFQFVGYLPIDNAARIKSIKELEVDSSRKNCTQIFIETPYRNNQLLEVLLKNCMPGTRLCIAANLTAPAEFIQTKTINDWRKKVPDLHKKPSIFLILAG